jgi:DNA-binding response OmpR family regulator
MTDRILLVEDDPKLAKFIESELGFEGYRVTVPPNRLDGLTIARDTQPDLLILDWVLPGISGLNIG